MEHRLPWVIQRGDITKDSVDEIVRQIDEADPDQHTTVLWTAAPPCQDFSRMRTDGPEHHGDRGGLFLHTVRLMQEVFDRLGRRRRGFLYEKVVMSRPAADAVSEALDTQPILACAGDFGWITRPRLWWLSVQWPTVQTNETDRDQIKLDTHQGWSRLRIDTERKAAKDFDVAGFDFADEVKSGRLRMPCATTPAADANGRPAPKGARGKTPADAKARWLADRRQFAPWHYNRHAMMVDTNGTLSIPSPAVKEQLHDIPKDYTAVANLDDRTRHRLIGNGWHWGVARRLLLILVAFTTTGKATAEQPRPPPHLTTIQWVIAGDTAHGPRTTTGRRPSRSDIRRHADPTSTPAGRALSTSDGVGATTSPASATRSSRRSKRWWRPARPTF